MEAMRLPAMCQYSPGMVVLSVILAIVISLCSLADVQLAGRRPRRWLAKGRQRHFDGRGDSGDAFTGMAQFRMCRWIRRRI